jgi:integrase
MSGTNALLARVLYGAGLRLMEAVRLRVKHVDLVRRENLVRDGKGAKDWVTMLPEVLVQSLEVQIEVARALHRRDLADGVGAVYLPFALERKYPNASRQWAWQYVFPADTVARDPRSAKRRRHHWDERTVQRATQHALRVGRSGRAPAWAPLASCRELHHRQALALLPSLPQIVLKRMVQPTLWIDPDGHARLRRKTWVARSPATYFAHS